MVCGIEGLVQIALIVMKLWLWRCPRRVSTIFPLFRFLIPENGKRVGIGMRAMTHFIDVYSYSVFCDVLIFLVYICIFYHEAYIAFLFVYVCTDLKHN